MAEKRRKPDPKPEKRPGRAKRGPARSAAADPSFTGPDHDPRIGVPDTGDVIGPDAADPDPAEVTDPADPSFVDPAEVE